MGDHSLRDRLQERLKLLNYEVRQVSGNFSGFDESHQLLQAYCTDNFWRPFQSLRKAHCKLGMGKLSTKHSQNEQYDQ